MAGTLGINPEEDVAGVIGNECFLCGKPIAGAPLFFGARSDFASQLPAHPECFNNRDQQSVAREYHHRISDMLGTRRAAR